MVNHPRRGKSSTGTTSAAQADIIPAHDHDADYAALIDHTHATFRAVMQDNRHVFRTDTAGLWETYLDALPDERQVHNCHACRRFVETYGGLVSINPHGAVTSLFWEPYGAPDFYRTALVQMNLRVTRARITGVFLSKEATWGTPATGPWTHLCGHPPASMVYRERTLTPGQAMAVKREDYGAVQRALQEFSPAVLDAAIQLLRAERLNCSEKFTAPVSWLRGLHEARDATKHARTKENLVWRAVAAAPAGFCHPRASVIGSLLEDIEAGLATDAVVARFGAKTGSLIYQRPQAAPSAGNIAQAERLVETLGIAPSLERRYARLDDVVEHATWRRRATASRPASGGVFADLVPRDRHAATPHALDAGAITWEKFRRLVLEAPGVDKLEMLVPAQGSFIALVTAQHADAPRIFKWDNPVNWYVYPGGSLAHQWELVANRWSAVTAVVPLPSLWGPDPQPHIGDGVVLVLEGCRDTRHAGSALFPEVLRSELHGARATIEAYSKAHELTGRQDASASGYDIRRGMKGLGVGIRVTSGAHVTDYRVDRWD